jgi:hypothetical protein
MLAKSLPINQPEISHELFAAPLVNSSYSQHLHKNLNMNLKSTKIPWIALALLSIPTLTSSSLAAPDPFYRALAKTQQQQFTAASQDLENLGRQAKRRGQTSIAYRYLATASLIRYNRDRLAYIQKNDQSPVLPDWYYFGSTLSRNAQGKKTFAVEWAAPPTSISGFGGLIILNNYLGYLRTPNVAGASIDGIVDTAIVPQLKTNETVLSTCTIMSGTRKNKPAIALVTYDPQQKKYQTPRRAWYLDLQSKRIKSIGTQNISCPDPEGD